MFDFVLRKPTVKSLYQDELMTVKNYQERLERRLDPIVDSSCGPAQPCLLVMSHERDGNVRLFFEAR